jgi:hypothetical protein
MSSGNGAVAGITGMPAATSARRQATLLPSVRITTGRGPIQRMGMGHGSRGLK